MCPQFFCPEDDLARLRLILLLPAAANKQQLLRLLKLVFAYPKSSIAKIYNIMQFIIFHYLQ